MMKARFMIESPNEMLCTMKLTMSMKEWENLRDQLDSQWPSSRLSLAINHVLGEARKVYYAPDQDAL